jgi:predicted nucleic acid-binding protein
MVMPDTSIWIEFARHGTKGKAASLRTLLDSGDVATCGPIVAELLAGAQGEVAERMWETLSSLPWAELVPDGWREVGETARRLRKGGRKLPLTDIVIAMAAARAGHALWSLDTDFERIGAVLGELELYGAQ